MSWSLSLLLYISVLFVLLLAGEWIVFALGIGGIFALVVYGGMDALRPLGTVIWNSLNNFTLTAIPLFILMGELILQSKLGERFYHGMSLLFPIVRTATALHEKPRFSRLLLQADVLP